MSTPEPPRPPIPPSEPGPPRGPRVPPTEPLGAPVVARPPVERPPEFPPEGPGWNNPWPVVLIGILGLIVGGLLGYELRGGKGQTVTEARGPAITHTVTNTTTVVRPKVLVQTNTVTQAPVPARPANEERRSEVETKLRKLERENEELKRQQGEP
jgi:hypothetical protein